MYEVLFTVLRLSVRLGIRNVIVKASLRDL